MTSWESWAPPIAPPADGGLDRAEAESIAAAWWECEPHLAAALMWESVRGDTGRPRCRWRMVSDRARSRSRTGPAIPGGDARRGDGPRGLAPLVLRGRVGAAGPRGPVTEPPWTPWAERVVTGSLPQPADIEATAPMTQVITVAWPRGQLADQDRPPPPEVIHLGGPSQAPFRWRLPAGDCGAAGRSALRDPVDLEHDERVPGLRDGDRRLGGPGTTPVVLLRSVQVEARPSAGAGRGAADRRRAGRAHGEPEPAGPIIALRSSENLVGKQRCWEPPFQVRDLMGAPLGSGPPLRARGPVRAGAGRGGRTYPGLAQSNSRSRNNCSGSPLLRNTLAKARLN